jgi:hypothetical protein
LSAGERILHLERWKVIAMSHYGLPLGGYDDASIWGYDAQGATYFAQLWHNGSDGDEADVSLNWFTRRSEIQSPLSLAEMISERTGATTAEVLRALGAATTAPESAGLLELADVLATAT